MTARAADETAVANEALLHLKQPGLTNLATDGTAAARTLRSVFGTARDAALRLNEWNFATGWAVPAALAGTFLGSFDKRYPLPEDCLKVRFVEGLGDDEWSVEPAADPATSTDLLCLATAASGPTLCYTRRIEAVRLWDPLFVQVFALVLAARAAPALAPSVSAEGLEARAAALVPAAARTDAREKAKTGVSRATSWLAARR